MPTWNPSLAIGVASIDSQHKELFGRADALLTAMRGGKPAEEVFCLVRFLEEYCRTHFSSEERLMRDRKHADLDAHLKEHALFNEKFRALVAQFEQKGSSPTVALGFQKLVCEWLVAHIGASDRKVASALAGPRPAAPAARAAS